MLTLPSPESQAFSPVAEAEKSSSAGSKAWSKASFLLRVTRVALIYYTPERQSAACCLFDDGSVCLSVSLVSAASKPSKP